MNALVKKLLAPRQIEYLFTSQDYIILETSFGVHHFAENSEDVEINKDVRLGFPELIGYEDVLEAIYKGTQSSFELKGIYRYSSRIDKHFYFDIYIVGNLENNEQQLMILFEDVTEVMLMKQELIQRANEANLLLTALAASKDYMDKVLQSMGDALIVTSQSGQIKSVNQATLDLFGEKDVHLIGKSLPHLTQEDELMCHARHAYILAQKIILKELEFCCHKSTGEEIWVEFSCSSIQTEVKNLYDFVYLGRDITERKREDLKIRGALAKEQELRQLKSRFFSMLYHEFNNPLNAISFGLQILQEDAFSMSLQQQTEYLRLMEKSTNNLLDLINDVRTISQAESGRLQHHPEWLNLESLCNFLIEEIKLTDNNQHAIFMAIYEENHGQKSPLSIRLKLDEKLMKHILNNLLFNAVKYSPVGSPVYLNICYKDQELILSVKDQGIGIPPEDRENLFESFYRAKNVGQVPGTGLGLSIVKLCIELQGGTISYESEEGLGTEFIVHLPIHEIKIL